MDRKARGGNGVNVLEYDNKRDLLFPSRIGDFLPEDHLARLVNEIVEGIDLSSLYEKVSPVGRPAYHPLMMVKILVYAYAIGVHSSRQIAKRLETDVAFIYLAGMQKPDFRTISDFRKDNLGGLEEIFMEVVRVCVELGMVGLGEISIDGTVMKGSASRQRTYDEDGFKRAIDRALKRAEEIDEKEDEEIGRNKRGDELPSQVKDKEKVKQATKRVEGLKRGREELKRREVRSINLTDPDATFQKVGKNHLPGYRLEAAIGSKEGVMVGCKVTNDANDTHQLIPMLREVEENLEGKAGYKVLADANFNSYHNLVKLNTEEWSHIDPYLPDSDFVGKKRGKKTREDQPFHKSKFKWKGSHYECPEERKLEKIGKREESGVGVEVYGVRGGCKDCKHFGECTTSERGRTIWRYEGEELKEEMRKKLSTKEGKKIYSKRKATVERAFGDIKQNMGFRGFCLRGLEKVGGEGALIGIGYNILRIYHYLKRMGRSLKNFKVDKRKLAVDTG